MLFLLFTNVRAPIHSLATHILVAIDDACHPHANHWLTYISMNVVGEVRLIKKSRIPQAGTEFSHIYSRREKIRKQGYTSTQHL